MREIRYSFHNKLFSYDVILAIYVMLKPLYLFKSGSVQLSDIFLTFSFIWILFQNKGHLTFSRKEISWGRDYLVFTIYIALVNGLWFIYMSAVKGMTRTNFISSILYYVFNLMTIVICLFITNQIGIKKTIVAVMNGCFFSTIVTLVGIILKSRSQFRNTSFFNNPNQLGFHAIIMLSFLCLFGSYLAKKKLVFVLAISIYAAVVSLSKACFISAFALGFLFLLSRKNQTPKQIIIKCGVVFLLGFLLYMFLYGNLAIVSGNALLQSLRSRVLNIAKENDSALGSGRGYNRLFEMGYHVLWGMGEGGYDRFATMAGYEIHSTYLNILVSYGVIGTLVSVPVFIKPLITKGKTLQNICCISGILLYCFSHNGIRNTLIWVMFSLLVSMNAFKTESILNNKQRKTTIDTDSLY